MSPGRAGRSSVQPFGTPAEAVLEWKKGNRLVSASDPVPQLERIGPDIGCDALSESWNPCQGVAQRQHADAHRQTPGRAPFLRLSDGVYLPTQVPGATRPRAHGDGGETSKVKRREPRKIKRRVTEVHLDGNTAITTLLSPTTDCNAIGAIYNGGGGILSSRVECTGPGQSNRSVLQLFQIGARITQYGSLHEAEALESECVGDPGGSRRDRSHNSYYPSGIRMRNRTSECGRYSQDPHRKGDPCRHGGCGMKRRGGHRLI